MIGRAIDLLTSGASSISRTADAQRVTRGLRSVASGKIGMGIAGGLGMGAAVYQGASETVKNSTDTMMEVFLGDKEADRLVTGKDLTMDAFYDIPSLGDVASSFSPIKMPTITMPWSEYSKQYDEMQQIVGLNPVAAAFTDAPLVEVKNQIALENLQAAQKGKVGRKQNAELNYTMSGGTMPSYRRPSQLPQATGGMVFGMYNTR